MGLLVLQCVVCMLLACDLTWWHSQCPVIQVVMTRLGYTQTSVATVSEHVMQKATRACLLACACLHSAEPNAVCHCDIRFANVLWDPQPFLADLEFAHFSPRGPPSLGISCYVSGCDTAGHGFKPQW